MNYEELFNNFVKEMENWSKDGAIPSSVTYDLQNFFKLRKKRLDKYGLKTELKFDTYIRNTTQRYTKNAFNIQKIYKVQDMVCRDYQKNEKYIFNNKVIYNKTKNVFLYCGILDADQNKIDNKYIYTCPNCGATSSIEKLQTTGCPYCRTKFIVYDLLPKIVNYSFENNYALEDKDVKIRIGIYIILSFILFGILFFSIFGISFISVIGTIVAGLITGFSLIIIKMVFKSLFGIKEDVALSLNNVGQLEKIYMNLIQYDEKFNYAYFEGKASSLFRYIAYSEDLNSVPQYKGDPNMNLFSNLIDSTYRIITLDNIREYNGNLFVLVSLFMNNTYFENNKIKHKRERISMLISHDMKFKTKMDFSIKEVNCKNCGSSFDALKDKKCPHCHNEYHLEEDDWIVNRINIYNW